MSDTSQEQSAQKPEKGRTSLWIVAISVLAIGAGFALSFAGILPGAGLLARYADEPGGQTAYLDLPQIVLSIPGASPKMLVMSITIQADQKQVKRIKQISPRIMDAFNLFLSEVDPSAFERRGVLDIVKGEMTTSLENILGVDGFDSILIMEFRIQ